MVDRQTAVVRGTPKLPIGETFSATLRTFRGAPFKLIALLLIPLPFSLAAGALQVFATRTKEPSMIALTVAVFVVQYALSLIAQCGAIYGASRMYRGDRFSFGEALGVGSKRFLPVLGALLLALLIYFVGAVVLSIPGSIVASLPTLVPALKGASYLLVIAGLIEVVLVLIPCIVLGLIIGVAIPACVIEQIGPLTCLRRSRALTEGNRWRILGAILLIAVFPLLVLYAVAGVFLVAKLTVVAFIVLVAGGLLLGGMLTAFPAVLFLNLKGIKEGAAPGRMTEVFE